MMNVHQDFDDARLAELEADFGAEDLGEVIAVFLDEAAEAVAGLAAMVSDKPDPSRADRLHFLVGSARNIGASGFADLCRAQERAAAGFTAADLSELEMAFREVRKHFEERVSLA